MRHSSSFYKALSVHLALNVCTICILKKFLSRAAIMGFIGSIYRQIFFRPGPLPADLTLSGKTVLVTGANSGIGCDIVRQCVLLNATRVIMAVRNIAKGEEAKLKILQGNTNTQSESIIEVWELDLQLPQSVAGLWSSGHVFAPVGYRHLLNAGVFPFSWSTSPASSYETSVQVNHLSTAMLSLLLLPVLMSTSGMLQTPVRLAFTSSEVHMFTSFKEQSASEVP
jgi:retinol dehydrogenase-12